MNNQPFPNDRPPLQQSAPTTFNIHDLISIRMHLETAKIMSSDLADAIADLDNIIHKFTAGLNFNQGQST